MNEFATIVKYDSNDNKVNIVKTVAKRYMAYYQYKDSQMFIQSPKYDNEYELIEELTNYNLEVV